MYSQEYLSYSVASVVGTQFFLLVTLELFILLINRIVFVIGDSYLFLAGGEYPDGSANKSVMRYDTCLDVWTEVAPMNIARSELGR